jgi:hypothetical protein
LDKYNPRLFVVANACYVFFRWRLAYPAPAPNKR